MPREGLRAGLKSVCSSRQLSVDLLPHLANLSAHGTTVVLDSSSTPKDIPLWCRCWSSSSPFIATCLLSSPSRPSLIYPFFPIPSDLPIHFLIYPSWNHFSSVGASLQSPSCSHLLLLLRINHPDIISRLICQCVTGIVPFLCLKAFQGSPLLIPQSPGLGNRSLSESRLLFPCCRVSAWCFTFFSAYTQFSHRLHCLAIPWPELLYLESPSIFSNALFQIHVHLAIHGSLPVASHLFHMTSFCLLVSPLPDQCESFLVCKHCPHLNLRVCLNQLLWTE